MGEKISFTTTIYLAHTLELLAQTKGVEYVNDLVSTGVIKHLNDYPYLVVYEKERKPNEA